MTLPAATSVNVELLKSSLDHVSSSYKFLWISGIIKEVSRGNETISFDLLASYMITMASTLLNDHPISLGKRDKLAAVSKLVNSQAHLEPGHLVEDLYQIITSPNYELAKKAAHSLLTFVPYRFLSPFFEFKTSGVSEHQKHKLIRELSQKTAEEGLATYSGTSGQSFRKHSDMKPESSGHLVS